MSYLREIANDVANVIEYSQEIYPDKVSELVLKSFHAKRKFIKKFGGLIYQYPEEITVDLNPIDRDYEFENLMLWIREYSNAERCDEIMSFLLFFRDSFFDNKVTEDYKCEDGTIIPAGMKLLKALKYFESDKDILTEIQNKASMFIQKNKISGYLCFSVHPLDFLSSSENTHNWRSCHALDGEYRAGNISYMLDNSTFMCYLKSAEDTKLPRFPESVPWNNKKWRCLMFVSEKDTMVMAGRPYPFHSMDLLNKVRDIIISLSVLLDKNDYYGGYYLPDSVIVTDWLQDYTNSINYYGKDIRLSKNYILTMDHCLTPIDKIVKNAWGSRQFNDLIDSSCYIPYFMYITDTYPSGEILPLSSGERIRVGDNTTCLKCGQSLYSSESMFCYECDRQVNPYIDEEEYE